MEAFLQWLQKNAVNGLISLLIFIGGVGLGVLVFSLALRFLKNGKEKPRKILTANVEPFVDGVIDEFESEKVKVGKEKITQLLTVASKLFEEIPQNYQKSVKYYEILKAKDFDFLENDLRINLDFSLCEGVRFLRATVGALKDEIYLVLEDGVVKVAYGAGKIYNFFKKTADVTKKPEDLLISDGVEIVKQWFFHQKNPDKKKGIVGKVGGKILTEVGSAMTDKYLKDFIREFAQIINLLYSDGFKEEKQNDIAQSTSVKEIA